jgi:hypothetical protein
MTILFCRRFRYFGLNMSVNINSISSLLNTASILGKERKILLRSASECD